MIMGSNLGNYYQWPVAKLRHFTFNGKHWAPDSDTMEYPAYYYPTTFGFSRADAEWWNEALTKGATPK